MRTFLQSLGGLSEDFASLETAGSTRLLMSDYVCARTLEPGCCFFFWEKGDGRLKGASGLTDRLAAENNRS
jgi:hypothetical protein